MHVQLLIVVADVCMGGQTNTEKRTVWWNQEDKEAIRAKKTVFRAWLANKPSEQLPSRYSTAHKTAASIVKLSKEKSWEEFEQKLDISCRLANKALWQTIRCLCANRTPVTTFIEDANSVLLKHQKGILNR